MNDDLNKVIINKLFFVLVVSYAVIGFATVVVLMLFDVIDQPLVRLLVFAHLIIIGLTSGIGCIYYNKQRKQ